MMVFRIAVLALLGSLLSGCGGGGGGGEAGASPPPASSVEFRLSLDRSALTFNTTEGGAPAPSQTIVATWTGTPPDPVYVTATVEGAGIAPTIPTRITQSSATATVSAATGLAAGTYTGRINFLVCRDAACNQRVGGTPIPVSFTVNVASTAVTSSAPISFQYVAGDPVPAPRTLQVANDAGTWTVTPGAAWLRVSPSSGQGAGSVDVSFDPAFAAAGTQTTSISIQSAKGTQTIPVSLAITTPTTPPPSGGTSTGEFTLSATSVGFTARRLRSPPASQALQLHLLETRPTNVSAGLIGAAPDWLAVSVSGQAPDYVLSLRVTNTNGPVGTRTAVIAVGTVDAQGNVLRRQDVNVSLRLFGVVNASAPQFAPSLVLGSSSSTASSNITITADPGTGWSVSSNAPWINTSVNNGTGSTSVGLTVDSSTLDLGAHSGSVTITNADDPTNAVNISVGANIIAPTISITSGPVVIGGADGLGLDGGNIALSINTGTNAYAWTATPSTASGDAWLELPTSSGLVNATTTNIAVDADRALVDPGIHDGTVTVQTTVRGHTYSRSVPIVLNKEGHWLQISSRGAAFSSFPGRSVLARSIQVVSSQGRTNVPWSATSDASWLTVTASGTTGGSLQLTANPTGLQQDTIYIANVAIVSSDPEIGNQEAIRVAFWVGSADPQDVRIDGTRYNPVANPVEPWVYVNNLDQAIEVYNVYTGALVATWSTTLQGVGDMSISQDGTLLFVNDWEGHSIVALDARTGSTVRTYAYDPNTESYGIAYINAGARPTLIVGQGSVYDVASGNRYTTTIDAGRYRGNVSFAVDPLSRYFYTQNMGLSASTVSKYSIKRTALNEEGLAISLVTYNSGGSNGQDICVSSDGARLYTANGGPYMFYVFDTSSFQYLDQLPGYAYPGNAECGWNGIFVGGASAYYETTDVWVYRADGSPLTSFKLGTTTYTSAFERSLVLSGDNTRLIGEFYGLHTPGALVFKNIPAP